MKTLKINNFGIIKSANINLNGLTVISGNNDTGKSTVGKLLFTIIKAVNHTEEYDEKKRETDVKDEIDNLYLFLRDKPNIENIQFGFDYFTKKFIEELQKYINDPSLFDKLKDDFDLMFSDRERILNENNLLSKHSKTIFDNIKKLVQDEEYDINKTISEKLQKYLMSEFFWNISPKNTEINTKINYSEGNDKILTAEISQNKLISAEYFGDSFFEDATLIETPLLLQIFNLINQADVYEENLFHGNSRPKTHYHIKDLINKVKDTEYFSKYASKETSLEFIYKINKIISGEFYFNPKNENFYFSKKEVENIEALNTASGIKSFGLFQLLAKANQLNPKNLIIIDEPENHLHPEWQMKYAEMIIEFLKNDISVILTTHSPFILQALKHYGKKENVEDKINFYLAEISEDNTSIINDVTKNLNLIFSKLAKPLTDLVWM